MYALRRTRVGLAWKSVLVFCLLGALLVWLPSAAFGQDARLHFERLNGLEAKAQNVVEVNVEGKILDLAKRVLAKQNDADARKVSQAISGLQAIYVRAYTFDKEGEFDVSDVDQIRAQLQAPGWEKLANVRSKKNDQNSEAKKQTDYGSSPSCGRSGSGIITSASGR